MYGLLVGTGYAMWRWWDPAKMELVKKVAVTGHHTPALGNLGQNTWLVVSACREHFDLIDDDWYVALNHLYHDTSYNLETHRQRSDVQHVTQWSFLDVFPL